jgi:hypothetical protein
MRLPTFGHPANVIFAGTLLMCAPAAAQDSLLGDEVRGPSFWKAAGGVAAVNGLTWFYNWRVQRWDWANVGTRSWWANLRGGFSWDDDAFGANQAAHPYHGSLYFNGARASGYGFWSSIPYVAAGSLSWELFTENVRPSLNDLINTTLGGIALGEMSYRISALLTSSGTGPGRQMGAFVVSPISRAQSLIYGTDRGNSFPRPETSSTLLAIGQQRVAAGSPAGVAGNRPFVGLTFQYGSPFHERVSRPYDAFQFSIHLSPNEHVVLTHAAVSGLLARQLLVRSSRNRLLLGLFQHYDYDDIPLAKASSQSLSGALLYRHGSAQMIHVELGLHLEAVPLGAVASEHGLVRRRDYDFGPGIGGRFNAALRHGGRDLLHLETRTVWIHSLYASDADHVTTTARVSAAVPVMRMVSLGGDLGVTVRRSSYPGQTRTIRQIPQFRAYLIWSPS